MTEIEYEKYIEMIHSIVVPAALTTGDKEERYQPWVEFLQKYTPEKLYRFRSCKERTFSELDKGILGFSPGYMMNDVFDSLLYFDKERILAGLNRALDNNNMKKLLQSFGMTSNDIESRLHQFYDFVTSDYDLNMDDICKIVQRTRIVSLCEEISSAAMWGYYADNGKGFAISYDLRGFIRPNCYLVPVIYDDKRFDATEFATWIFQQQTITYITAVCPVPRRIYVYKSIDSQIKVMAA